MKVIVKDFSELGLNTIPELLVNHLRKYFPLETTLKNGMLDIRCTLSPKEFYIYVEIEK